MGVKGRRKVRDPNAPAGEGDDDDEGPVVFDDVNAAPSDKIKVSCSESKFELGSKHIDHL